MPLYPRRKGRLCPLDGRLMGSRVNVDVVKKKKNILVPAGNRSRVVQPIGCHTDPTVRSPADFGGYLSQVCNVGDTDTIVDL